MALNSIGEIETAPGAARHESAQMRREAITVRTDFITAAREIIEQKSEARRDLSHNGRVSLNWADMSRRTGGELKKTPAQYRIDAGQDFLAAEKLHQEIIELQDQIKDAQRDNKKDKKRVIIDTVIAKAQTFWANEL